MGEQLDIFDGIAMNLAEGLKRIAGAPDLARKERVREQQVAKRYKRKSIDQRFAEFATANPHVFDELLRLARQKLEAGATRIATKALWEDLRASLILIADGGGPDAGGIEYKLNNDFTALYARMLVRAEPKLEGVIEMRRRKRGG